jgi:hypothetical protein
MTLTLLSTLAFAYRIFPLISADKGGGNFAQSRVARLCTGTLDQNAQPTELFGDSDIARCSVPVVVIESSDNVLWVSRTDDRGGAVEDGQKCAPEIWAEGHFYPRIFEINRTKLSHVEYERVPATGDKVRLIGRKTDIYEVLNTSDHESRFEVRSLGGKTTVAHF